MLVVLVRSGAVSEVLGYLSIGSWLGAQFPQLLENARLQSVDGLALPFLANWFFGDATNLIGCLLTDQLPFQTLVASYFCFVDICLLAQFLYYSQDRFTRRFLDDESLPPSPTAPTPPLVEAPSTGTMITKRRRRSVSEISELSNLLQISTAAATIAAAANAELQVKFGTDVAAVARAASTSPSRPRTARVATTPIVTSFASGDHEVGEEHEEEDSVPGLPESPVTATSSRRFPSLVREPREPGDDSSETGTTAGPSYTSSSAASTSRRKRNISWGPEPEVRQHQRTISGSSGLGLYHPQPSAQTRDREPLPHASLEHFWDLERGQRGRTRLRGVNDLPEQIITSSISSPTLPSSSRAGDDEATPVGSPYATVIASSPLAEDASTPIGSQRRRKSTSRAAPIIFFGVWLLFSFSGEKISSPRKSIPHGPRTLPGGVVLRPPTSLPTLSESSPDFTSFSALSSSSSSPPPTLASTLTLPSNITLYHINSQPQDEEPDMKHVIGRISAWTCTTLYLTSRLPQIWKNYARKSVEGLTMSLFVCAFLGNLFYVASILTNPTMDEAPPIAAAFLKESIPYILGSGGTLLFDVTIVAQSFWYRGRKPLDPPLSSASGYLPPRSVGVHSSIHSLSGHGGGISGATSRSNTLRSRMGSMKRAMSSYSYRKSIKESAGEEAVAAADHERAPLLRSSTSSSSGAGADVLDTSASASGPSATAAAPGGRGRGSAPRYRSTSSEQRAGAAGGDSRTNDVAS